jgi:hypothetical protein
MYGVAGSNSRQGCIFFSATLLLFYTKQEIAKPNFRIFSENLNYTSLYGPIVSGASVDPTSQVCSPAMLVLPIAGNCEV